MTPRPRLVQLAAAIALVALLALWLPSVRNLLFVLNGLALGLAVIDLFLSPGPRWLSLEREAPHVLSVGGSHRIHLHVFNRSRTSLQWQIYDHEPIDCISRGLPIAAKLPGQRGESYTYRLTPNRRGVRHFTRIELRVVSRWGLWNLADRRPLPETVRIYPNLRATGASELTLPRNQNFFDGQRVGRRRGEGGEFDRLREYRREDELRRVDWKASARHLSLISRDYRIERNQHVLLLLDCGRTMANLGNGMTHFDRALGAAIALSHLALNQGDYVSMVAFSNRIERSLGPVRGKGAIQTLLDQTFDLEPRQVESDYQLACEETLRKQRRRALVILLTHALDEQHLRVLEPYARVLRSSHLVLLLLIEDREMASLAQATPAGTTDAFATAAAAEMVHSKRSQIALLRRTGVRVLETVPESLTAVLVEQYLNLKAEQTL